VVSLTGEDPLNFDRSRLDSGRRVFQRHQSQWGPDSIAVQSSADLAE
jgi:hypothetical protein